jgi:2-polyprenyl-3-methyl-5-hydroxy-6-metoxy-1,4-benzoquinol methylase
MDGNIDEVPRGNTCPGVNQAIIEYFLAHRPSIETAKWLDVPCGDGQFLDAVKQFFPNVETTGADIVGPQQFDHEFVELDASDCAEPVIGDQFDIVTCISGVMEFDNTLAFFRRLSAMSTPSSTLVVTNDNVQTIRDRLLFLLFGRFRQYRLDPHRLDIPTWKLIHLANLVQILKDAGYTVREVKYVTGRRAEWLWLPLAIPIYLAEYLYRRRSFSDANKNAEYFSLESLVARHYLLICGKDG